MSILIFLFIIGIACTFIPMDQNIKNIIYAVCGVIALIWVLNMVGFGTGLHLR